ncbi:metallophosphoesterase family protein [Sphingomonas azotifigens]|uniref:metallophosphoesterase family protein n=1 Tax=Sphingomonas azotifigens TaxID=330920 RepID=UPI0009FEBA9D|nr:metallophosphoesterase family protein [Sphingomonas azotifigens]
MRALRWPFRTSAPDAVSFAVPQGVRAYAIGDVHGRRDLLEQLLARIDAERRADPRREEHLILLGDLIDRGPESRGVVDLLLARSHVDPGLTLLCGNHEEMLLAILDGAADQLDAWLRFGGAECAESYGVDPLDLRTQLPEAGIQRLRAAIPAAHLAFFRNLRSYFALGDYVFVHAGVRPGIPIERQQARDLRWIRAPFLRSTANHGAMVVHGHTISEEPESLPNRIGIDTGAYASGRLTALCIDGAERRFLDVRG